jgi:hypothetical protein
MDTKFASLQSLLDLAQKMEAIPETTAVKVQKELLQSALKKAFEEFMSLGVSLPDLFTKFGAQLYKAQVLQG